MSVPPLLPQLVDDELRARILIDELLARKLPIPPALQLQMYEREAARRGLLHRDLAGLIGLANPTLLGFEHVPGMVRVAQRVIERELDRVMVLMPPRYFKSEVWSKLLPAAYLLRHPTAMVALSSYTAHLAWELSGASQSYYSRGGGLPTSAVQARDRWSTQSGGLMWAVGAGGTIVGRGFHLGVVDDPINPEHASSVIYQQRFRHWWTDIWVNRQEPHMATRQHGAQIVVVMQRLGPSDPIDFLFRREVGEQCELAPEHWHVVLMDEIKSEEPLGRWNGPKGLPPTCTLEGDPRPTGTILAPHRFSAEAVKAAQAAASPLTAAAQRQQRPMRAEGAFWRSDWFLGTYEALPKTAYDGGTDWDTAFSQERTNSACAFVRSFRGPVLRGDLADQFTIYIDDVNWQWVEFPALVKWMRETPGPHYIEAKASGKSAAQSLRQYRIPVQEVTVTTDKLARASLAQPVVSQGRVMVQERVVQRLLWGERQGLLRITAEGLQMGGEGTDLNDAFVQALFRHCHLGAKTSELAFR